VIDPKLLAVEKLQQVAAIRFEHPSDLGYDDVKESLHLDIRRKITGKSRDDALASLVHLHLSLKRELLRVIEFYLHMRQRLICVRAERMSS
jgi:hypothetical protein